MGVLRDREIPFRILSLFLFWKTTLDRKGRGLKFPHRGLDILYCSWQHKRVWKRRLGLREEFSFLLDSIKKPSFSFWKRWLPRAPWNQFRWRDGTVAGKALRFPCNVRCDPNDP